MNFRGVRVWTSPIRENVILRSESWYVSSVAGAGQVRGGSSSAL